MTFLRSLAFNVAFFAWSIGMNLLALPLLVAPRTWLTGFGQAWLRGVLWLLRVCVGLRHEVRGRGNLPSGPCLIAAKHQSAWEIFLLPVLLDDPSFVVKRELMSVPLFGWYLRRYGVVAVDRKGGGAALRRMVREAKAQVACGRSIVIFPEGTRVPAGESRPYHPGVAALYRELDLPVVPVALNSGLYWRRRAFLKRPGRIVLAFQPPIPAGLDRRDFMKRLAASLDSATDALLAEARGRDAGR